MQWLPKPWSIVLAAIAIASSDPGAEYRKTAIEALAWIESTAIETEDGIRWPVAPDIRKHTSPYLYDGNAGVVLFYLAAHDATGDKRYLKRARNGANALMGALDRRPPPPVGLYTGIAGLGFVFGEVHRATGDGRYRAAMRRVVDRLGARAKRVGNGVDWNGTTDIIAGSAGVGLFLLHAARILDEPDARKLAARAGRHLVAVATRTKSGLDWPMTKSYARRMPNFSHGTAGVAYSFATLYRDTEENAFLDAAKRGATHLMHLADKNDGGCKIGHHLPGGEDLFYLGWCHGPPGTARLFHRLHEATDDEPYRSLLTRAAHSVLTSGIPEERTDGFWNNVGVCCGSAGVIDFCVALYRATGEKRYLAFARRLADDLIRRATNAKPGLKWIQAEHRVRPDLLQAQTGYMQGAAGIGMTLLRLHAVLSGETFAVRFPDAPW